MQPATSKLYKDGWNALPLDVTGGLYVPPTGTHIVMGATETLGSDNASLTLFSDNPGIPTSASAVNPNLSAFRLNAPATFVAPSSNPAKVKLSITAATGLILNSSFSLGDGTPLRNNIAFYGMIIPNTATLSTVDGSGHGFYLLPGLTSTDPTRSGRVSLRTL